MLCPNCGTQNPEGVRFCEECGKEILSFEDENSRLNEKVKSKFVESDEKLLTVLGNNMAKKFLSTGKLENGFAVLSDKRLYFFGRCYIRVGKGFFKKMEERVVDLDDVTGTGFVYNQNKIIHIIYLVFAALSFSSLWRLIFWIIYFTKNKKWAFYCALGLFCGIPLLLYFLDQAYNYSLFEVSYAGGGIAFDLHFISKSESDVFQKTLQLAKSNLKKKIRAMRADNLEEPLYQNEKIFSVPEELEKYKKLLDSGIITQEEFDMKKKELLRM